MARFLDVVPRIPVADLARSIAFYNATLGFTVGARWPDDGPTFAILGRDAASMQLYVPDGTRPVGETMLNVEVTDTLGVHASLPADTTVEWGPEDFWYGRREFAMRDPDGHLVIVTQDIEEEDEEDEEGELDLGGQLFS